VVPARTQLHHEDEGQEQTEARDVREQPLAVVPEEEVGDEDDGQRRRDDDLGREGVVVEVGDVEGGGLGRGEQQR